MEQPKAIEVACTCGRCGGVFTIVSAIGASTICRPCANWILMPIIWRA